MSPAHRSRRRRWPALVLAAVVMAGLALLTDTPGAVHPGGPPVTPGAIVTSPEAESSAWYCTGQTTAAGKLATGSLVLTNTSPRAVTGSITAVSETGATAATTISVPPRGQLVDSTPVPASGSWVSASVTLSGGGVAVSQFVQGQAGWSEAPCQSGTAPQWYFPSGLTTGNDALTVALFNPTSTPDVVDLSFVTPAGVTRPINYQGIILQPYQMAAEDVGAFVQNQGAVATTVSTRTGRVVASELQVLSGNGSGLAIVPGSPLARREWVIPQSVEVGGKSVIDVFNPGSTTERVTVQVRLASGGPVSPFTQSVLPDSSWSLPTSGQTRIPEGDAFSVTVEATGGPGVVVGRIVGVATAPQAPQAGMGNAVDSLTAGEPSREWLVPSPGSAAMPAVSGVVPAHLALDNTSAATESYVVSVMTPSGDHVIASGKLAPSAFASVGDVLLFDAGLRPLVVRSSGTMAIIEDVGPTGGYGVVTMPGIPLQKAQGR